VLYIYSNLKYLREQLKLSQNMFSQLLGINVSNICRWENKKNGMSLDMANIISEKLNIPLPILIGEDFVKEKYLYTENKELRKADNLSIITKK